MSLKEKIAIGFVIFMVVVFAIILRGTAAISVNINGVTVNNLDALASVATYDRNGFMDISPNKLLGSISAGNYKSIYYKSAMCMYHRQSTGSGSYSICNVIDFKLEDGVLKAFNNRIRG